MKRALALAALLMVAACGSSSTAATTASPGASPAPSAQGQPSIAPIESPSPGSGSKIPSPSPLPVPAVSCKTGSTATALLQLGGPYGSASLIYDVSDPLHPKLVCTIDSTTAHLFTGDTFAYLKPVSTNETDVILHSLGSGNESKAASFPLNLVNQFRNDIEDSAWTPNGSMVAYTIADENANTVHVWLYSQGKAKLVHDYGQPIGDCICRFGLPAPVLAFSPDRQFLAAGWEAGKGSTGITVIRVSDGATLFTADTRFSSALWDHSGHRLYLAGTFSANADSWTPEAGLTALPGGPWSFVPGISPDGTEAAYTAYADPDTQLKPRVFTYDLKANTAHLLIDQPRAEVVFVKDGWVWYDEEQPCATGGSCAGSTTPSGKFFAMQLSTGVEQPVTFASGEAPGDAHFQGIFTSGVSDYWPNS